MKKRDNYIAIFFLLFILVIPVGTLVRGFESSEEQKPFTFAALQNNLTEFTNRLFLKTKLIDFNSELVSFITGGRYLASTQVMTGKNGWLFYKTQGDGFPIHDYMGINHFSDEQLRAGADNLVATRDALEKRGIQFIATCIPNKEIVYEENMADTVVRVNSCSRGQQFAEYIQNNTDVKFVYPLDEFLEAKENNIIYYKTDTHWNQVGAFIGINELFKALYGKGDDINSVNFVCTPESFKGDLAIIGNVENKVDSEDDYAFDLSSANPELRKDQVAIVVGDSFGGFMSHVARGYYTQVEWIFIQDFTWDMIDKYNPDVVIWETVERYVDRFTTMSLDTKTVPELY